MSYKFVSTLYPFHFVSGFVPVSHTGFYNLPHVDLSSCRWQCKDGKKNANSGIFVVIRMLQIRPLTYTRTITPLYSYLYYTLILDWIHKILEIKFLMLHWIIRCIWLNTVLEMLKHLHIIVDYLRCPFWWFNHACTIAVSLLGTCIHCVYAED